MIALSDADVAVLYSMYKDGMTVQKAAKESGHSPSTVSKYFFSWRGHKGVIGKRRKV